MEKVTFIILGATGDLTKRKLIPAIYNLIEKKKIRDFAVLGVSRDKIKPAQILNRSKKYIKNINKTAWNKLKKRFYYLISDFYDENKFCSIGVKTREIEAKHKLPGNRVFYLATLPHHFKVITTDIKHCGLAKQKSNWTRVVFEKPFGHDLKSAKDINKTIKKVFSEKQIYRIDHYLGKELIQSISALRFTNTFLEPIWNSKYIDHIQLILSEDVGIEERGPFYDKYGAIRDVVQNHMLQMLSLVTMESPKQLSGDYIRDQKVKVLKSIKTTKELVIGQYKGYRREKGIPKNSKTETFAALKLFVKNARWKNVPIYCIVGKKMKTKITSIYVEFKEPPCLLFRGVCDFKPNYLVIQIQPEEGFYLQMNSKLPGKADIVPVKMDFCHSCTFGPNTPIAYENLLFDVIRGDQSAFVRTDEIEQQWKIVDKIKNLKKKLLTYPKGSKPSEADSLIKKDGRKWHLQVK